MGHTQGWWVRLLEGRPGVNTDQHAALARGDRDSATPSCTYLGCTRKKQRGRAHLCKIILRKRIDTRREASGTTRKAELPTLHPVSDVITVHLVHLVHLMHPVHHAELLFAFTFDSATKTLRVFHKEIRLKLKMERTEIRNAVQILNIKRTKCLPEMQQQERKYRIL
ncbi:hypothetical protein KM043_011671 [Ampulex compressa]|nr:hypothetical protein KM043_011671 [Ampulex compressa]